MNFSPWFAYDCMITAANEGRWQAAFDLASALLLAANTPGSGAPRWFKRYRWQNVVSIELEARRHPIDTVPKGVVIECPHRSTREERSSDPDSARPSEAHSGPDPEEVGQPELHRDGRG